MSTIPASPTVPTPISETSDRAWYIVGRWEEYEGETRANLLRVVAVAAFYVIELINYYGVDLGFIHLPKIRDAAFHQTVTAIAAAILLHRQIHATAIESSVFKLQKGVNPKKIPIAEPSARECGVSAIVTNVKW